MRHTSPTLICSLDPPTDATSLTTHFGRRREGASLDRQSRRTGADFPSPPGGQTIRRTDRFLFSVHGKESVSGTSWRLHGFPRRISSLAVPSSAPPAMHTLHPPDDSPVRVDARVPLSRSGR